MRNSLYLWMIGSVFFVTVFFFQHPLMAAEKQHTALTYYNFAPFIIGDKEGMAFDFIELLNKEAKGNYQFHLKYLPRKRINQHLAKGDDAIVILVNPAWFKDSPKTKYLWSPTILSERIEVISRIGNPPDKPKMKNLPVKINYTGVESLAGLRFGGLSGRVYKGLTDAFQRGIIPREDVDDIESNLFKLLKGRIDFGITGGSFLGYLVKKHRLENQFYLSPQPFGEFTRHFLLTKSLTEEHAFLTQLVLGLPNNLEWQKIKGKYGMQ